MRRRSKNKYKGFEAPPGQKRTAGWSRSSGFQAPPSAPVPRPDMWAEAPGTVGTASATPGLTVAAVQAALGRRVDHYLITDDSSLMTLVNNVGGVTVQAESSFSFQGQELGPGQLKLTGAAVLAYLTS